VIIGSDSGAKPWPINKKKKKKKSPEKGVPEKRTSPPLAWREGRKPTGVREKSD